MGCCWRCFQNLGNSFVGRGERVALMYVHYIMYRFDWDLRTMCHYYRCSTRDIIIIIIIYRCLTDLGPPVDGRAVGRRVRCWSAVSQDCKSWRILGGVEVDGVVNDAKGWQRSGLDLSAKKGWAFYTSATAAVSTEWINTYRQV